MRGLVRFFRSRWEEVVIIGIVLPIFGASLFTFNPTIIIVVGLGELILLVALFSVVASVQAQRVQPARGENVAFKIPRRGVVFTVGLQEWTLRFALENQKPAWVGFLCTAESEQIANQLIAEFNLPDDRVKRELVDAWNIREVRAKTEFILNWMERQGVSPSEMAVDVTGGSKTLSVGAFSVAEERRVDSQYVRSEFQDNKPKRETQEAILISRFSKGTVE